MLKIKRQPGSLFTRLLSSFILIIILFISFNFLSYSFSRDMIQDEIIRYNHLNLDNTVRNYEAQFRLERKIALNLLFSPEANLLKRSNGSLNYEFVSAVNKSVKALYENEDLFIYNIMVMMSDMRYVIDKDGSHQSESLFSKYYLNPQYNESFWLQEMAQPFTFKVYPASTFTEKDSSKALTKRNLLPVMIKNNLNTKLAVIILLDGDKLFEKFHQSINPNFMIMDNYGQALFTMMDGSASSKLPSFPADQTYTQKDYNYYFYKTANETGFSYINRVPYENISTQFKKLNIILFSLLLVAILFSVGASIFISIKFNNPIKRIIESVQHFNSELPKQTQIKEFNIISDQFNSLLQTNKNFNHELAEKNSLLRYYSYTNKLKQIYNNAADTQETLFHDKPFQLVIFQLTYRKRFNEQAGFEQDRASSFFREFIQYNLVLKYDDPATLQLEKDEIIALVFIRNNTPDLRETLEHMKKVFDLDKELCFLTIAYSGVYRNSSEITKSYEEASSLVKLRRLNEDTQIIEHQPYECTDSAFSPSEAQEFHNNLSAGNLPQTNRLVQRMFDQMSKKQSPACHFAGFALSTADMVLKTLASLNITQHPFKGNMAPAEQLKECHTLEPYKAYFESFLSESVQLIKQKKEAYDPMITFAMNYLEEHYGEDASLDVVADKLNISGTYLSTNFKEKTGINFIEYLNGVRIRKAKHMLEGTDLKIQDISHLIGYQTINSFIRMFKKHTGLSPGEYRKMHTHPLNTRLQD
ncbi:helix-turn-helix domain-containing protein [Paenibacillus sp. FSL H7-0331]|uniref:AraC family transcriptional regulator n=1 Tax=Paenibacillus sp. FSL H7-0331 TaxID=1920421 RepID=UPI00096D5645|nr:helix-turn-helix domain-containing protein [Paenibacillus sp. FSL H7-0331]OMF01080.1 hypothetical protein BK127_37510 [Paenibacillus sp. FSL H7-0331]